MDHSRPHFPYFHLFYLNVQLVNKILLMLGFEPQISGFGSDHSTNWATTTDPKSTAASAVEGQQKAASDAWEVWERDANESKTIQSSCSEMNSLSFAWLSRRLINSCFFKPTSKGDFFFTQGRWKRLKALSWLIRERSSTVKCLFKTFLKRLQRIKSHLKYVLLEFASEWRWLKLMGFRWTKELFHRFGPNN